MRLALAVACVACFAGLSSAAARPQPPIVFAADRTTTRTGEIYSVDLRTGVTRDISRSLASDSGPAVSPDGDWIAFGSTRSGTLGLYIARLDGSSLRLLKRFHRGLVGLTVQWAPDGEHLAASSWGPTVRNELWIGTPAGAGATRWDGGEPGHWSADSRSFAYAGPGVAPDSVGILNVVDTRGRLAWRRSANQAHDVGWSADGRLTWVSGGRAFVATEAGRQLPGFPAQDIAWSPDGRTLAVLRVHVIELRHGGAVRTVYRANAPQKLVPGITWLGASHVVFTPWDGDSALRLDLATLKTVAVGYEDIGGVVSPDQRLLASSYWPGGSYRDRALRVGPLLGQTGRVLEQTRDCPDDHAEPFDDLQFVPGKQMVVYLADCGDPTADLYSVRPDGGGVRQLTFTAAHEQSPTLSPDGSRIAYVRSESIGHGCEGCPSGLWVMDADGSHARRLTYPAVKNGSGDWDANPSWSPDGTSIVFDRSTIDSGWRLMVISAGGGTPRALPIPGARNGVWGPQGIAYTGVLGAIWTTRPDGSDRRLVAPRHTCDSGCYYAWTASGLVYATVTRHVTHTTVWLRGAGGSRRIQLPFAPARVGWTDGGATLLVAPPADGQTGQWSEGDLYRVAPDGTLTRLTTGLGAISLAG